MELVAIFRLLWDRRIIVALGVIFAVAAGLLAGRESEARTAGRTSGVGSVRMVLDTARSQLLEAAPKGADSLPARAALLANALATDTGTALVARQAGVVGDQLAVRGPAATKAPALETPLVRRVAEAASTANVPYVVNISADELTPIISIDAYAPDRSQAAKLVNAAAAGLRSLLVSADSTHSRGFVLETVAPLGTEEVPSGSRGAIPIVVGAGLLTLLSWCVCVVLVFGAVRRMRQLGHAGRRA